MQQLLPLADHAHVLVIQNESLHRQTILRDGRHFLNVHQQRCFTRNIDDQGIRVRNLQLSRGSPGQVQSLRVQEARVRMAGWSALTDGVEGVTGAELKGVQVTLPAAPDSVSPELHLADLAELVLPERIELPFPVTIQQLSVDSPAASFLGEIRARPDQVTFQVTELHGAVIAERIAGTLRLEDGAVPGYEIRVDPWDVQLQGALVAQGEQWNALVTASTSAARVRFTLAVPRRAGARWQVEGDAHVELPRFLAERFEIQEPVPDALDARFTLSLDENRVAVDATLATPEGSLTLTGALRRDALEIDVETERFDAGALATPFFPELAPHALIDGRFEVRGTYGAPTVTGTLRSPAARVRIAGAPLALENSSVVASWSPPQPVDLQALETDILGGRLTASGEIPLRSEQAAEVQFSFQDLDLAEVRPWLAAARDVAGRLEGKGTLTVGAGDPQLKVEGTLRDGVFAGDAWERIRDLGARFRFSLGRLEIAALEARVGGGTVLGEARLDLDDAGAVAGFDASMKLKRVRLARSSDVRLRGSGTLKLTGTPEAPELTGRLRIDRGIYDRNFHPQLTSTGVALPFDLFSFEEGFASRLLFDLTVETSGGFLVRNNRIQVAPVGSLHLGGSGRQPVLTGSLAATEGTVELPHLRLQISRAEVVFPESDPFHPSITFAGSGKVGGVEVSADASGALLSPTVVFSSNPSLNEEDLLLLIATGRRREQLDTESAQLAAATELLRLYGPGIWEQVFGRSREPSFLDRITISTEATAQVGDEDRITVELKLYDWLAVATERDHRGDINLDLLLYHSIP